MSSSWLPDSWKSRVAKQQPLYPDDAALSESLRRLASLPTLTTAWEVERLRGELAEAVEGRTFVLQGGDCSESFDDCNSTAVLRKLKVLIQMSLVLIAGARKRVVRIGRIAGQYAKPRSSDMERRGDVELPSYRGDIINKPGLDRKSTRLNSSHRT